MYSEDFGKITDGVFSFAPKELESEGVKTLTALSDKIDTTRMKKPSFLMVLTANGPYAYRRDDGVYIVPISCLKD